MAKSKPLTVTATSAAKAALKEIKKEISDYKETILILNKEYFYGDTPSSREVFEQSVRRVFDHWSGLHNAADILTAKLKPKKTKGGKK